MKTGISILMAAMLALSLPAFGQHEGNMDGKDNGMAQGAGNGPGPRHEKFDTFRKMKMIEVLKLNEDEAARFVSKETAHGDAVRKLMEQRNGFLDDIRKAVKDGGDGKGLDKAVNDVLAIDDQMFKERRRFQDELRAFFTPDKFAKYLVFEREFGRGVRDAIQGMARDRWRDRSHEE